MIILESLLIAILIFSCLLATVSDIKKGIIPNKLLLISGAVCLVINTVYYAVFAREYFITFLINFVILVVLSILMYAFNLWAAGDSRLLFLIVFALPARFYMSESPIGLAPAIFIIVFTFSVSFIYVVGESFVLRIKRKDKKIFSDAKINIKEFLKNYIVCTIYILAFNYVLMLIFPQFAATNASLITVFNLFISIIIFKYSVFFKPVVVSIFGVISIALLVISGIKNGFYPPDLKVYIYLALILFLRNVSEKFNYDTIPTEDVKKGMILAKSTVVAMSISRIKGLPTCSSEDMRSRLTQEQVDSILRWKDSKYGYSNVVIVRKIPFAIFMTIGVVIFLFIRLGLYERL